MKKDVSDKKGMYEMRNFYDKILDYEQTKKIDETAVRILEEIGTDIYNEKAVEILCKNGARKLSSRRVSIPQTLVRKALKSAPEVVNIYDRANQKAMELGLGISYFGTGPTCPYIIDKETQKRRFFIRDDCKKGSILCDALKNIDFVMSMGTISDTMPHDCFEIDAFYSMVSKTKKPLIISAVNEKDLEIIYNAACLISGNEKRFSEKPFFIQYYEPTSPLKHSETAVNKLIFCSEKRIPLIYTPAPSAGGTSPVTLAGTLALATAEVLTGLVLNQMISEGAPFIYGGVLSILDMRTMNFCYGAPEFLLFVGALADMARYYKLPSFTTGGVSDSKTFDAQASSEYALSLFASYMSRSDLIHDIGFIESGMTCSYEGIVYGDELLGLIKRIGRGIEVTDETLAFEVIKQEGVGGFFLDSEHTIDNYKKEHWFVSILDRSTYNQWKEKGSNDIYKVLNEKAHDIINTHEGSRLDTEIELRVKKYLGNYYNID